MRGRRGAMRLLSLCVCASGVVSFLNAHRVDMRDVIVFGRRKGPPRATPAIDLAASKGPPRATPAIDLAASGDQRPGSRGALLDGATRSAQRAGNGSSVPPGNVTRPGAPSK